MTERIEIITAIKPYLYHPVVLAKQALQIEEISGGRFAINLVNGWFKPEIERAGIHFAEHDDRYAYGREWVTVVESLLRGERTTFRRPLLRDRRLRPAAARRDARRGRASISAASPSRRARSLPTSPTSGSSTASPTTTSRACSPTSAAARDRPALSRCASASRPS